MTFDPTPISDYDHWNEEAPMIWWEEVGRFGAIEEDPDDYYEEEE